MIDGPLTRISRGWRRLRARTGGVGAFAHIAYDSTDRLDPGQEAIQAVEVNFPASALKARKLKEIRIELACIPSSYKLQTAAFPVSIGGQ